MLTDTPTYRDEYVNGYTHYRDEYVNGYTHYSSWLTNDMRLPYFVWFNRNSSQKSKNMKIDIHYSLIE